MSLCMKATLLVSLLAPVLGGSPPLSGQCTSNGNGRCDADITPAPSSVDEVALMQVYLKQITRHVVPSRMASHWFNGQDQSMAFLHYPSQWLNARLRAQGLQALIQHGPPPQWFNGQDQSMAFLHYPSQWLNARLRAQGLQALIQHGPPPECVNAIKAVPACANNTLVAGCIEGNMTVCSQIDKPPAACMTREINEACGGDNKKGGGQGGGPHGPPPECVNAIKAVPACGNNTLVAGCIEGNKTACSQIDKPPAACMTREINEACGGDSKQGGGQNQSMALLLHYPPQGVHGPFLR